MSVGVIHGKSALLPGGPKRGLAKRGSKRAIFDPFSTPPQNPQNRGFWPFLAKSGNRGIPGTGIPHDYCFRRHTLEVNAQSVARVPSERRPGKLISNVELSKNV
jgi:hypothetical protein